MALGGAASGLSDAPQAEPAGLNIVVLLVLILQAPVALAQWIAVKASHGGDGLPFAALCLIAFHSSIGYGYLFAFLLGKVTGKAKSDA
jgi:hypothetical protein